MSTPRVALALALLQLVTTIGVAAQSGGPELQINETTAGYQRWPDVDVSDAAGYVVVWQDENDLDGSGAGIFGRLFDAAGIAGNQFLINANTADNQVRPDVAMADDGSFIVAWDEFQKPAPGDRRRNIIARRFASDGTPSSGEIAVSSDVTPGDGPNTHARVAIARDPGAVIGGGLSSSGRSVIVWQRFETSGERRNIYARRYDSAGTPLGDAFLVNSTVVRDQERADVAMAGDASFVVVWDSYAQDDVRGVYGQRFDAAGQPAGSEFRVHQRTLDGQCCASVAPLAGGGFVIAYEGDVQDGDGRGVFTRFFNPAGTALAPEIAVNTTTVGHQGYPSVTTDAAGEVVVIWQSAGQDGDGRGIYSRRFSATGQILSGEMLINVITAGSQDLPAVAKHGDDFFVVWRTYQQDGDGFGVNGRRFSIP